MRDEQLTLDMQPLIGPPSGESHQEKFWAFHEANPQVMANLERLARRRIAAGRTHLSMKKLWEDLRDEYLERTTGDVFKLNNNYTAYYAREIVRLHPQWAPLFSMRAVKAS
jgi:hypothetical protein